MYTQKMIGDLLKASKTRFVCIVGYDDSNPYTDVMFRYTDVPPTEDYMCDIMDFYKPLEVRGSARDMIWVDCFDAIGSVDLPRLVKTGELTYTNLLQDMKKK